MFCEDRNEFNTFVRPSGFTRWILMSIAECKQKLCLFTRKLQRALLILYVH